MSQNSQNAYKACRSQFDRAAAEPVTKAPGNGGAFAAAGIVSQAQTRPRYFVIPTDVVAGWLYVDHRVWLTGMKRDGTPRKDTPIRVIRIHEIDGVYEEAWDLLKAPADKAPVRVPARVRERGTSDIGWPEGHPGLFGPH